MTLVHIYTGPDGRSRIDRDGAFDFTERDGTRTAPQPAGTVVFFDRRQGFADFHCPPGRQYMFYLSARVELGVGDGTTVIMEPGDVLLAEDTTGQGHTSRVLADGLCAIVTLVGS